MIKDDRFVSRDHILDVDKRVFSPRLFEQLQSLLNKISNIGRISLSEIDLIPDIQIPIFHKIEGGQNLSVVRHQVRTAVGMADHESLQDFADEADGVLIFGVEGQSERYDELRNSLAEFFSGTGFDEVEGAHDG